MAPGVKTLDSPTVRKTTLLWMDAAIIGTPAETTEQLAYELVNLDTATLLCLQQELESVDRSDAAMAGITSKPYLVSCDEPQVWASHLPTLASVPGLQSLRPTVLTKHAVLSCVLRMPLKTTSSGPPDPNLISPLQPRLLPSSPPRVSIGSGHPPGYWIKTISC